MHEFAKRGQLGICGLAPSGIQGQRSGGVRGNAPEAGRFSITFLVKWCNIYSIVAGMLNIFLYLCLSKHVDNNFRSNILKQSRSCDENINEYLTNMKQVLTQYKLDEGAIFFLDSEGDTDPCPLNTPLLVCFLKPTSVSRCRKTNLAYKLPPCT